MIVYLPADHPIRNSDFGTALAKIRQRMEEYELPQLTHAAARINNQSFEIVISGESHQVEHPDPYNHLLEWITNFQRENNFKVVAMSIAGQGELTAFASKLWLELDIIPLLDIERKHSLEEQAAQLATLFDKDGIEAIDVDEHQEVHPSFLVDHDTYRQNSNQEEWDELKRLGEEFSGKKMMFISATSRGGGVALMRHALIRLYRLMGIDAHWHILTENHEVFQVTKGKFHNILQNVSDPSVRLTPEDKTLFENWSNENAEILTPAIRQADVIVIDDPQPSALIPHIKELNPEARLLYRSHIQIETHLIEDTSSPQSEVWNYLWNFIQYADAFIAHPVDEFIPPNVPQDLIFKMPPTTDILDGLNKILYQDQIDYYMHLFNRMLLDYYQEPIDLNRPYIIQIARFDPSKGIPDVIESYRLLREKLDKMVQEGRFDQGQIPQLVICGHGSIDDPDGKPIFELTLSALRLDLYKHIANDIKIMRLPHNDQLLNALMRKSKLALQLSHREGFEIKVTEALFKGKPVISYRAGGIPLQIAENENGFVIEPIGDCEQVAQAMLKMITDQSLFEQMAKAAYDKARRDLLTVPNAIKWMQLALDRQGI